MQNHAIPHTDSIGKGMALTQRQDTLCDDRAGYAHMHTPTPHAHTRSNLAEHGQAHLLALQQFRVLLTFFPKSFSQFPHGTCFLSVPNPCLASDEHYHPLCTSVPRSTTLGSRPCMKACTCNAGVSPSLLRVPKCLHAHCHWSCNFPLQFRARGPDCQRELILVHSPLPKESLSVCCPLLTYMLKFSRSACLA